MSCVVLSFFLKNSSDDSNVLANAEFKMRVGLPDSVTCIFKQ